MDQITVEILYTHMYSKNYVLKIKFYNLNIFHPKFKTNDNLFAG